MIPLRFLMMQKDPRRCRCCGGLYRESLKWVNDLNETEISLEVPLLWGDATMIRLSYPEETWDDPVWERNYHMVRRGRMAYSDDTKGHERQSDLGDRHMLLLMEKLKFSLEKEELRKKEKEIEVEE